MSDQKKERRGLGRGLSALMADVNPVDVSQGAHVANTDAEVTVPIDQILPNADQPRRDFDDDQLAELAASIKEKGVIQPLIVRAHPENPSTYQIVAGERRWRASQIAGLHDIPVLVRDYSDIELLEIAIIENIQRAELNSIEEAAGYRQLMDKFGHTQEKIAEALGKSRSHIANLLRLLKLPEDVQDHLRTGKLTAGHARALVTVDDPSAIAKQVIQKGLSVRDTETLAKHKPSPDSKKAKPRVLKDADTIALERDLSAATGMKIQIDHKSGGESGRISVDYKSLEDLDRICNFLSAMN